MLTTPAEMSDDEREQHIQDCGRLMLEAMANGNREEAEGWLQAQNLAIAARSAAQVAKMEQAAGLSPCFFADQGDKDRIWLLERQAA
jgi:hypothetical protein